ncbi:hypothetical protein RJT17_22835 [Streptomyces sp. P5-A9]|uniref:hypothetical protein n=1 Tax=Streptomyces sp. P5-A9 TaxID=3071730 RepID=UPI002FCAF294
MSAPVTLPMTAAGCDHNRINTLTREALAAQGLVMGEDYESLSVIFPAQKTGCAWAGLGSVPGPYTWINLYGTAGGLGVLGHEFGHNLGLGHQGRSMCTDGDLVDCTSNGTSAKSLMGGGGPAAGFSAPEMIRAGWLSGSEAVEVDASGTYTLRSLHGAGEGTRALDIPMGEDRLVVEYRHAAGTLDGAIEGVHVYRVPKGAYGSSALIDMTEANKTVANDAATDADAITAVTDTASKVSVAVVSSGGGKATGEGLPRRREAHRRALRREDRGREPGPGPGTHRLGHRRGRRRGGRHRGQERRLGPGRGHHRPRGHRRRLEHRPAGSDGHPPGGRRRGRPGDDAPPQARLTSPPHLPRTPCPAVTPGGGRAGAGCAPACQEWSAVLTRP